MDVRITTEELIQEPLNDYLRETLALAEARGKHLWLTVESMMINGDAEIDLVCSEWQPEREALYHNIALKLTNLGIDINEEPEQTELGILRLIVNHTNTDMDNALWKLRREYMREGLCRILAGWGRLRDRIVIVSRHSGQLNNAGEHVDDHIHVIYQKEPEDGSAKLAQEITAYVESDCSWETLDQKLGIFGAANTPEFDDEYDEAELDYMHPDDIDEDYPIDDTFEEEPPDDELPSYEDMAEFGDIDIDDVFDMADADSDI